MSRWSEEKDFIKSLDELQASLRNEIEAKALHLDASPEAIAQRRRRVLILNFLRTIIFRTIFLATLLFFKRTFAIDSLSF